MNLRYFLCLAVLAGLALGEANAQVVHYLNWGNRIYTVDLDQNPPVHTLTSELAGTGLQANGIAELPDGRIVYSTNELWMAVMNPDGTGKTRIQLFNPYNLCCFWSGVIASDTHIFFSKNRNIYRVPIDFGGAPVQPDVVHNGGYVMDLIDASASVEVVASNVGSNTYDPYDMKWDSSNDRLYFSNRGNSTSERAIKYIAGASGAGPHTVQTLVDVNDGIGTPLTFTIDEAGQRLFYDNNDQNIQSLDIATLNRTTIFTRGGSGMSMNQGIAYDPASDMVYFSGIESGDGRGIARVPASGGAVEQMTTQADQGWVMLAGELVLATGGSGGGGGSTPIFEDNFDTIASFGGGATRSDGTPVRFRVNFPQWSSGGGVNPVHATNIDKTQSTWGVTFYDGNTITSRSRIAANAAGTAYEVKGLLSPSSYSGSSQITQAGDYLLLELLDPSGTAVVSEQLFPNAWTGVEVFEPFSLSYTGTGTGDLLIRISDPVTDNSFGGGIDNLCVGLQGMECFPASSQDSDGDGTPDDQDAFPNDPNEDTDTDGDGVGDNADAFPNDATETTDTDGDGVGDNADAFPNDATETTDTDGDGVGDNADAFPNDATETTDSDGDGVGDNSDNAPNTPNPGQEDADGDGVGDVEDAFPNDPNETTDTDGDGTGDNADAFPNDPSEDSDTDGDGVGDNSDNAPNTPNPGQEDADGDGVGDVEDAFPNDPNEDTDTDGDGVGDNADAFPNDPNEDTDTDGDGVGDNTDNAPTTPNPGQEDADGDGVGDVEDAFPNDPNESGDSDGDGVGNNTDNAPNIPNPGQEDNDGDGIGDVADPDDDNDGTPDTEDAFPLDPNEDTDTDGDGVGDNGDAFPEDANETTDTDGDGTGDNGDAFPNDPNEDTDTDGDGVGDNGDAFPSDPNETSDQDGDGIGDNADPDDDGNGLPDLKESVIPMLTALDGICVEDRSRRGGSDKSSKKSGKSDKSGKSSKKSDKSDKSGKSSKKGSQRSDLEEAIFRVERSLTPKYWTDATHPNSKHGHKIFDEEKKAVKALDDLIEDTNNCDAVAQEAIDALVAVDMMLVDVAISEVSCSSRKCSRDLAKAEKARAKADDYVAKGKEDKAIDQLKLAWNKVKRHASSSSNSIHTEGLALADAFTDLETSEVPERFELQGNYPNPFNPQTTIGFSVPESAQVTLTVYDMLGRRVKVLVDGVVSAGRHEARFDATDLPSGAYLYRLSTPKGEFTNMMMLLK